MDDALVEFVIPGKPTDLENQREGSDQFEVKDVYMVTDMHESELFSHLDDLDSAMSEGRSFGIIRQENFDVLYSFVSKFSELKEATVRDRVVDILCTHLMSLISTMDSALSSKANAAERNMIVKVHRNALKMYVFLLNWVVQQEEKEEIDSNGSIETIGKRGKKKAPVAQKEKKKRRTMENQKERIIRVLCNVMEHNIAKLWDVSAIEESLINLFFSTAFAMLENPANLKVQSTKDNIFHMINTAFHRLCNRVNITENNGRFHSGAISSLVELLVKHEHIPDHMVALMKMIHTENENLDLVNEVLREIGKFDTADISESAAAKNLSAFVSGLSEVIPKAILANMSVLIRHLSGESYPMRSGILHAISRVISEELKHNDSATSKKTRDQLLDILLERFRDTNSFTRGKALQCWCHLVEKKCVPKSMLPEVIELAVGRLYDKTSYVRKAALHLLSTALEHNPYNNKTLQRSSFEAMLKLEKEILNELSKADSEPDATPAPTNSDEGNAQEDGQREVTEQDATVNRHQQMVLYNEQAIKFIRSIEEAVSIACKLLSSKTPTDVVECIKFLVTVKQFKVENAMEGVKKMLGLVWHREQPIRDALTQHFQILYRLSPTMTEPVACVTSAKELISLSNSCTLSELMSLEQLIKQLVFTNQISNTLIQAFWQIYTQKIRSQPSDSIGAAVFIGMIANAKPTDFRNKVDKLMRVGLGEADPVLAKYTCIILQNIAKAPKSEEGNTLKLPPGHPLFVRLAELLIGSQYDLNNWFSFAEQAICAIFTICKDPEPVSRRIIQSISMKAFPVKDQHQTDDPVSISVTNLCKLIFILGHAALKRLVFLEEELNEVKRRANEEMRKAESGKDKASKKQEDIEDELGLKSTSAMESEAEARFEQKEREIISRKTVYGLFAPLVQAICSSTNPQFKDPTLQKCAVLTLCKFMCVSNEFCANNLQLLFTILKTTKECELRSNIVIALGDMARRFPNDVEPWTKSIYECLRDPHPKVRKNTLQVLAHLILNDMIKFKGSTNEMALAIEDEDESISTSARSFFTELSKKGGNNPIYNILPDTISRLSADVDQVTPQKFRNIMKFLIGFIEKDKQTESLVDKLCNRFTSTNDTKQFRDIAYCLTLLNYNEKCAKKLTDNLKLYQHALYDKEVYESISSIGHRVKKNLSKNEAKGPIDEWIARVDELHQKLSEEHAYSDKVENDKECNQPKKEKKVVSAKESNEEDDDSDVEMLDENSDNEGAPGSGSQPEMVQEKSEEADNDNDNDDGTEKAQQQQHTKEDESHGNDDEEEEEEDGEQALKKKSATKKQPQRGSSAAARHATIQTRAKKRHQSSDEDEDYDDEEEDKEQDQQVQQEEEDEDAQHEVQVKQEEEEEEDICPKSKAKTTTTTTTTTTTRSHRAASKQHQQRQQKMKQGAISASSASSSTRGKKSNTTTTTTTTTAAAATNRKTPRRAATSRRRKIIDDDDDDDSDEEEDDDDDQEEEEEEYQQDEEEEEEDDWE